MKKHSIRFLLTVCVLIASAIASAQNAPPPDHGGKMPPPHVPKPPMDSFANWGRGNDIIVVMEQLKKSNPEEYNRLSELRKTDKQAFFTEIKKRLPSPKNSMRKMFKLETECRNIALTIAECKDEELKKKLEQMLKDKLKESFDFMIEDSTERIEKMRRQLEALKANEDAILEERLKQFLSPDFQKFFDNMHDKGNRPPMPHHGPNGGPRPPAPPPEPPMD